jgi:broad specificity phosphatase PhoE
MKICKLFLVRHGESASNAGLVTEGPVENPITEKGRGEAQTLANLWGGRPDLIVTSPFIRTQQTSEPLRALHPEVPHEEWAVQEFTQLAPCRYKGTTHADRGPRVREYWERNDALYNDGAGAESFKDFRHRVERLFDRAAVRFDAGFKEIAVFTHATFMQAALYSRLKINGLDNMSDFYRFSQGLPVPNVGAMCFQYEVERDEAPRWLIGPTWSPT